MPSNLESKPDVEYSEERRDDKHIDQTDHVVDDVAAAYLDPTVTITPEENIRLRRKLYWRLLPIMGVAYVTQSLDKGTLGTSSIMGWQKNVGAKGQDYALTSTLLWVGIVIGEPIINQFVRKLPVAKLLGISMFIWTALVYALAFSLHMPSILAIRTLLGFFESSFSPCLVAITVQWFTKEEQTMITTVWQSMLGFASVIANLLAFGFYHLPRVSHGHYTWQWMMVCIASISLLASVIVIIFLPDTPTQVKWASDEEKSKYLERVRANDQGIKQKKWRGDQAWEVVRDPLVYSLFLMNLSSACVGGGLGTFSSLLINRAFGFTVEKSLLLNIGVSAFQIALYYLFSYIATVTRETCLTDIGATVINIIGTIVLIKVEASHSTRVGLLIAFLAMQSAVSLNPNHFAMLSRNIAGQTKKSIVYAIFLAGWAGGNAIGPLLFQAKWAPRYINTLYIHIGLYVFYIANAILMRTLLKRRNAQRENELAATGGENLHLHAFEDLTDLQNQDFRYMY